MYKFPIGVLLDSFRLDPRGAMEEASKLKLKGIQVYATSGDMAPEQMSAKKRRDFLSMADGYGLKISALCGDLGHGFGDEGKNPTLIEKSKRILDLAKDLNTNVVTTHIGVVPQDKNHPRYGIMQDACGELARYADSVAAHFAIETGPETAEVLKEFLDSLGSTGVSVNLDPANLVMVTGDDPAQAVHILKDYIVHTHAKDGIKLQHADPELIYGIRTPLPDELDSGYFEEVPLGEGKVDWPAYLNALDAIGYQGFLTIEREVGNNPGRDIQRAAEFLRRLLTTD